MRIALYILFIFLFSACQKPENVSNLNNNRIAVVGHGGNGLPGLNDDLPFDSYEGAVKALEFYNADGVELDVKLSADSVLFMYHDKELDASTSCTGCMFDHQSTELEQCTLKNVTASIGTTYYLSRLEKVLSRYTQTAIKPIIFLDLHADLGCGISGTRKEWYYSATLYAINALLSKYNAYDQVLVQANSFDWMMEARTKFPAIKLFLDVDIDESNITEAAANGFYGIACKNGNISKEEITYAHAKGLRVQVYGIGGNFTDAINKYPDYILSDNITLLQNTLNY